MYNFSTVLQLTLAFAFLVNLPVTTPDARQASMLDHDCVAVVPLGWLRDAETKERF
jgi:hypothetical protein